MCIDPSLDLHGHDRHHVRRLHRGARRRRGAGDGQQLRRPQSRYHYYDGTPFHRIIPGFVIQGGDGDASAPSPGFGNPGYVIDEEPPPEPAEGETAYDIGSFAMAKGAGSTATGAQFFVVTGEDGAALPPEYSLFGQITDGMDVVTAIESIPTTPSPQDAPTEEIYIESVTITEG